MEKLERRLILAIQQAPLSEPPWQTFVRELRLALGGNLGNVVFRLIFPDGVLASSVQDDQDVPDWLEGRAAELQKFDPMPYFTMKPGQVYAYEEFDTVASLAHDRFREELLELANLHHLIILRVVDDAGSEMWVAATRPRRAQPFGAGERSLLQNLAPHLSLALKTHVALVRTKAQMEVYARAAGSLSFGVVELDLDGRVISVDEAAKRTLAESSALFVARGRLQASDDNPSLQRLIADALVPAPDEPPTLLRIGGAEGVDVLLAPQVIRPDAGPGQPRVLVYLSRGARGAPDVVPNLRQLFGLTPTQGQLAALMASGCSLANAAAKIGITEQTARTYSKEIYAKVGVRGQGELIQRILTSVAVLGSRPTGPHPPRASF